MTRHTVTVTKANVKLKGKKPDLSAVKRADTMRGLEEKLRAAKEKMAQKIAEKDTAAAQRLEVIIKNLEQTLRAA